MAIIECSVCGNVTHSVAKGSGWITIILMFFLFIPAVIYEIWRRTGLGCCGCCGSSVVFPTSKQVTYIDSAGAIKQSMGRIVLASTAIVVLFCVAFIAVVTAYQGYLSWKERPLVEAFERKHADLVLVSRSLLDGDVDLLKAKQKLELATDSDSSCLSIANKQLNSAIEAKIAAERIKQMPFGNDTTQQMMQTVRDYSQHLQAAQSTIGSCRYRRD